ncbi:hypothetical protein P8452_66688 [Trifolium repens]|nr:hypothetical protein P8452_66688 [Trifolium repens]
MKGDVVSRPLDEVEALIGVNVPKKVEILPPKPSHTKGCGKRIKGGKEKAMEQQQKSIRQCHTSFGNETCTRSMNDLFGVF